MKKSSASHQISTHSNHKSSKSLEAGITKASTIYNSITSFRGQQWNNFTIRSRLCVYVPSLIVIHLFQFILFLRYFRNNLHSQLMMMMNTLPYHSLVGLRIYVGGQCQSRATTAKSCTPIWIDLLELTRTEISALNPLMLDRKSQSGSHKDKHKTKREMKSRFRPIRAIRVYLRNWNRRLDALCLSIPDTTTIINTESCKF